MKTELNILILDNDDHDVERIKEYLRKGGFAVHAHQARNQADFINHLADEQPDLILSEHDLPGFNGFAALSLAKQKYPEIPFVLLARPDDEETKIETLEKSGVDYVLKNRLSRLVPLVQKILHDAAKRKEHHKLEQALTLSEEYYRTLVDSINDYALCHLDEDGRVHSWNPGAEWITGFTAIEITGRHFSIFYPAETATEGHPSHALAQAIAEGRFREETELLRKDGTKFWADVLLAPLSKSPETSRGFALVMRDITARRNLELERERMIQDLRDTLTDVKILSGSMPICASCKKVRDYTGQWHPLEVYLREHSEASVTHEFCHDCAQHIQSPTVQPVSLEA